MRKWDYNAKLEGKFSRLKCHGNGEEHYEFRTCFVLETRSPSLDPAHPNQDACTRLNQDGQIRRDDTVDIDFCQST